VVPLLANIAFFSKKSAKPEGISMIAENYVGKTILGNA
jgi:hypothetical protein